MYSNANFSSPNKASMSGPNPRFVCNCEEKCDAWGECKNCPICYKYGSSCCTAGQLESNTGSCTGQVSGDISQQFVTENNELSHLMGQKYYKYSDPHHHLRSELSKNEIVKESIVNKKLIMFIILILSISIYFWKK